jgi:DNA-binding transcriptional ArsR family regulator
MLWHMQISDPKAITALAHPLRLDLLELLTAIGPATAARCGRILGVPQANCSFHLRQLARYGFVEDAGPGRDRRERQWRLPEPGPTIRIAAGGDEVVRRQLERVVVEREMQAILSYAEREDDETPAGQCQPPAGRPQPSIVTAVAVMSAADAVEIKEKWKALIEPYIARTRASNLQLQPGQRYVRYFMAATPIPDLDPEDSENEPDD